MSTLLHLALSLSGRTPMAELPELNNDNAFVEITIPEKLQIALRGKPPSRTDSLGLQMQKVPDLLRLENDNHKDYDPLVVSFGPYHHGKPELRQAEDFKLKALQLFVEETGKDVLFYYNEVLELINDVRNCYIVDSTHEFDDPKFAQMMLLDACFIIHFILSFVKSDTHCQITSLYLGDFVSAMVLRDLFLLENQIPFWVLKRIVGLGYGDDQGEKLLNDFLNLVAFGEYRKTGIVCSKKQPPFHFLDAFWLILVSDECTNNVNPTQNPGHTTTFGRRCSGLLPKYCCSLRKGKDDNEYSAKKYVHSFRSVTDLKAKGIHFRPSRSNSLTSIRFISGCIFAQLEVPIRFVSIYTKVLFLNMIAYEVCPSANTDRVVTAYIEFMKSLINTPEDVKELREKKILLTKLSSDDEVANIFKEIRTYGLNNITIFHKVKEDIQAHYNNKANTWLAEFLHTYFRSPWSVIALLAATFLLVLTFVQTYFTVNSSSSSSD